MIFDYNEHKKPVYNACVFVPRYQRTTFSLFSYYAYVLWLTHCTTRSNAIHTYLRLSTLVCVSIRGFQVHSQSLVRIIYRNVYTRQNRCIGLKYNQENYWFSFTYWAGYCPVLAWRMQRRPLARLGRPVFEDNGLRSVSLVPSWHRVNRTWPEMRTDMLSRIE